MSENIGWLFYRDYYYRVLQQQNASKLEQERHFTAKNQRIERVTLPTNLSLLELPGHNESFTLKTTYPGLLIGTGYMHGTGLKGEIKIGFFFDHTTGVPILPGSSVKGMLRSVFPGKPTLQSTPEQKRLRDQKAKFLRMQLTRAGVADAVTIDLNALEAEIFDGTRNGRAVALPERDVFGDAYPSVGATDNKLLGTDFITPHGEDLTKNPTPIQMLRVLPGVTFTFQFRLTNGLIDADNNAKINAATKGKLFKQILLHLGAGAKTNVGYGRFEDTQLVADTQRTYYTPPAQLKLLPDLTPKPHDNPLPRPVAAPPQRPSSFSDIVPPTETFTRPADSTDATPIAETQHQRVADPYTGKIKPGVQLDAEYVGPLKDTRNRHRCKVWLAPGGSEAKEIAVDCIYGKSLTPGQIVLIQVKDGKDKINLADIVKIYR